MPGLTFALKVASAGTVAIITKKQRAESNTNYAQGGIAAVMAKDDSLELHVRDTLEAGAGLCNEEVVRTIVSEGPALVRELIEFGVKFTETENARGQFDLGREGGHSKRRVLHAGDITGREIERALLAQIAKHKNITVLEEFLAVDLITTQKLGMSEANRCLGCYALDEKRGVVEVFAAKITLLATGGSGKVYLYTSNPGHRQRRRRGDGVPGGRQHRQHGVHPVSSHVPLSPEGEIVSDQRSGARRRRRFCVARTGKPFMKRYHKMADLAPRDIVARAIDAEMKKTGAECVWLDITHKDPEFVKKRFPNIYAKCLEYGYDMTKQPIPVVPAAHYQCGGVVTNVDGETEIAGLAGGRRSGVHGLARREPAGEQFAVGSVGRGASGGRDRDDANFRF